MEGRVASLGGCLVDDNACAGGCEGAFVVIVVAVEACPGGEARLPSGGAEQVEGDISLGHKEVPFAERELGVACGKAGAEVVFPCRDGSFGGIAAMNMWWDPLEGDFVFLECLFEFGRAFVVQYVEFWGISIGL